MATDGPGEFCDAVRGRLVGALTLTTGNRAVAEELAQEALVRAWQRWDTVSRLESPEAWTVRVGLNLAASWHRRRTAEWRANRRSASGTATPEVDHAAALAVRQAVADLPHRQRAVIVARFFLGYDVATTAEVLGCAHGTVKATTHQAIERLKTVGFLDDEEVPVP